MSKYVLFIVLADSRRFNKQDDQLGRSGPTFFGDELWTPQVALLFGALLCPGCKQVPSMEDLDSFYQSLEGTATLQSLNPKP